MEIIIDYTDETREAIIKEQESKGYRLIEDQRHFDGNHLVFDDGKPVEDLFIKVTALEARVKTLEDKIVLKAG